MATLCQNFAGLGGAACTATLPIQLVYFKAALADNKPLIQWSVASPKDLEYYVVEKSSDGKQFFELTTVMAKQINNSNYEYKDANCTLPTNWYRLRLIAKDGSISFSHIISIKLNVKPGLHIYPNPASDYLFVTLNQTQRSPETIAVSDITGKILMQKTVSNIEGNNYITLNISKLTAGTYFLITGGNEKFTSLFVKK